MLRPHLVGIAKEIKGYKDILKTRTGSEEKKIGKAWFHGWHHKGNLVTILQGLGYLIAVSIVECDVISGNYIANPVHFQKTNFSKHNSIYQKKTFLLYVIYLL